MCGLDSLGSLAVEQDLSLVTELAFFEPTGFKVELHAPNPIALSNNAVGLSPVWNCLDNHLGGAVERATAKGNEALQNDNSPALWQPCKRKHSRPTTPLPSLHTGLTEVFFYLWSVSFYAVANTRLYKYFKC